MNQKSLIIVSLFSLAVTLSSCELAKGIFKAGMWTAVIIIVAVVALILFLVGKAKK